MQVNYIGYANSITLENKVYYYYIELTLFIIVSEMYNTYIDYLLEFCEVP